MGMITGTELYDQIDTLNGTKRESLLLEVFTSNQLSPHLKDVTITVTGKKISINEDVKIEYTVLSDYLCVGTEEDYFLIPMAPTTAQKVADHFNCILPTKKMVDQIFKASQVKLYPTPISPKKGDPNRESTLTYRKHNRLIEDQLKNKDKTVLLAGHKKDVVITNQLKSKPKAVAIYGWHYPDGKAIQPLYLGHGNFYADYSHGIRLVKKTVRVNGVEMNIEDVLKDRETAHLLSHEGPLTITKYP